MDAALVHQARHDPLDGHAVGDVDPPAPRLAEALRADIGAVALAAEVHARRAEDIEKMAHVVVPAVDEHVPRPAVERLGVEFHKVVSRVEGFARLVENGHVMVVPAADAARTLKLALVDDDDILALVACAQRRAAAGCPGADDEHVGFHERAQTVPGRSHADILG